MEMLLTHLQDRDEGNRTENLRLSWEGDLAGYLEAAKYINIDQHDKRVELASHVQQNPQSAVAWWTFLLTEEVANPRTACATPRGTPRTHTTSLCDLYRWATRLVPRQESVNRSAFINLWLGFARQQW